VAPADGACLLYEGSVVTEQDVLDAMTDGLTSSAATGGLHPELDDLELSAVPTEGVATLLTVADGSQFLVTVTQIAEG
jgi:hypothetical protein